MKATSTIDPEVLEFHRSCLVLDLHADTPVLARFGYDLGKRHSFHLPNYAWGGHVDLPRMREGGLDAQCFGLCSFPFRRGPAATVGRQLDALERVARKHPNQLVLVRTAGEIRAAREAGRIAGLRGIEGAHALERDLDRVAHFAGRGVIYLGLLHFSKNEAGAPLWGKGRDDSSGLTDFGRDLVDELNRRRVMVDLAHINKRGLLEAAARSKAPVLVSHTGLSGACGHWRNIDDEQIRAVADTGGCIGVMYSRHNLCSDTIEGVCAHLEHLVKVGGEDCPALGSDFDGAITPVRGLEDVSRLPGLTAALLGRGLGKDQVSKILGKNALRTIGAVVG